jgi:hypothetical protein
MPYPARADLRVRALSGLYIGVGCLNADAGADSVAVADPDAVPDTVAVHAKIGSKHMKLVLLARRLMKR